MKNSHVAWAGSLCFVAMSLISGCVPIPTAKDQTVVRLEGRIDSGTYHSPGNLFRVEVPVMRNPFIKQPNLVWDQATGEAGFEVTFAVPDLGEAHRFGARGLAESMTLDGVFKEELERWTRHWVNAEGKPIMTLEEQVALADGTGLGRVYLAESASLLFGSHGEGSPMRESALIGVVVVAVPQRMRVLYFVSQFDMPNQGGHFTLETKKGREHLAEEHMLQMRQLAETFRLQ